VARTDVGLVPRAVVLLAGLVDLEPLGLGLVELVAGRALALGHPGHDRADVVRPVPAAAVHPRERDGRARVRRRDEGRGAGHAVPARHVWVAGALHGRDVGDLPDGRAGGRGAAGERALVDGAVDGNGVHGAVGEGGAGERRGEDKGGSGEVHLARDSLCAENVEECGELVKSRWAQASKKVDMSLFESVKNDVDRSRVRSRRRLKAGGGVQWGLGGETWRVFIQLAASVHSRVVVDYCLPGIDNASPDGG
jgi:hypothetical protein